MKAKKTILLLAGCLVIIAVIITALFVQRLFPLETAFIIPENAVYVLVYSTGEGSKEKESGTTLEQSII